MAFEEYESNETQDTSTRNKLILKAINTYYTKEKLDLAFQQMKLSLKKLSTEVSFIQK